MLPSQEVVLNAVVTTSAVPRRAALALALQRAQERLVARPALDALGVAHAAVVPILAAAGTDPFDPLRVRPEAVGRHLAYHLLEHTTGPGGGAPVVNVYGVGDTLAGGPSTALSPWALRTNGGLWQLALPREAPLPFGLFDSVTPAVLMVLFGAASDRVARAPHARAVLHEAHLSAALARLVESLGVDGVRQALRETGEPEPVAAMRLLRERELLERDLAVDPGALAAALDSTLRWSEVARRRGTEAFASITAADAVRHAGTVRAMRGRLEASLDGIALPVTSRTGLYVVLAALALQVGRADAVPAGDLVAPPEAPEDGATVLPLPQRGHYLRVDGGTEHVAGATAALIDRLGLRRRLACSQRGRPYPD